MDPSGDSSAIPTGTLKRSFVPSTVSAYLDPHYWDERFSGEEHYEWLKDYSHFRHLIQPHLQHNCSVLEIGCGNSRLSEELYEGGITEITCIDLSAIAVEKMQKRLLSKGYKEQICDYMVNERAKEVQERRKGNLKLSQKRSTDMGEINHRIVVPRTEIRVLEADMLDLPFADECFDVVIEKGTMDVLFVDSGDPWNPQPETVKKAMAMLQGVHRVLKPDGVFISISFGQPHFRRPFFDAPDFTWSFECSTFGDGFHYFFYLLKKGTRTSNGGGPSQRVETPSISLFQDELESEDYIFRTNIDEMES